MNALDAILSRLDETDRPAFRALIECGTRPDATLRKKLGRGRYRKALEDSLTMLSEGLEHAFPPQLV